MTAKPLVSLICPVYNEAAGIAALIDAIASLKEKLKTSFDLELIVINDGSEDQTLTLLLKAQTDASWLRVIDLSRNFGKEAALSCGLDEAKGDCVIPIDADLQDPPELIPAMLSAWRDEGYEVVLAKRQLRSQDSWGKRASARWFYRIHNHLAAPSLPEDVGDFRLMDRRVVDALKQLPERNRFMKGLYAWVGFASTAIDYEPLPRAAGESSFGLRGSFALAFTGVLAFSIAPLRALTLLGFILATLALGYGAFVIAEYFLWGIDVPGYATLVVGMMFFSGIQLLSIGVLAEYVGRIYEEVKQRPMYLVSHRFGAGLALAPVRTELPVKANPHEPEIGV